MPAAARDEFSFWWQLLGGLTSAVSLISLAQKAFSIGLAPLFAGILDYYRAIFYPLIEGLLFFVPFHLPDWYKDLFCLAFVFGLALVRHWSIDDSGGWEVKTVVFLGNFVVAAMGAVTLYGLLAPIFAFSAISSPEEAITSEGAKAALTSMIISIVAAVLFFLLNGALQ